MTLHRTLKERVLHKSIPVPESGCWIWLGAKQTNGYAHLGYMGKTYLVHRVSYEQFVDAIPDGLVLDHLCKNRDCVNPDHLRPITQRENMLDINSMSVSAICSRKLVCPKCGSKYTKVKVGRECVPCRNKRNRAYRLNKRTTP